MTKTRSKQKMPEGFFTDMIDDTINVIASKAAIADAGALALTNKRHYNLLHRATTRRYLQSLAVIDVLNKFNKVFCLTQSGQVFVSGRNALGQLGLGDTERRMRFEMIPNLTNIKQMLSCGTNSTMFVTLDGEVLTTGNTHNNFRQHYYPMPFIKPSTIPARFKLIGKKKIAKAVSSNHSTWFLTNDGEVYVLGRSYHGELGMGDGEMTFKRPTLIRDLPVIKDIVYSSSLYLLAEDGTLYACGWNDAGQLGVGDRMNREVLTRVPNLVSIKCIKAGDDGSFFALTNQGKVYAWGQNEEGELGLGDTNEHNSPTLLTGLPPIISMEITDNRYFVTAEGSVYVFGKNSHGELGLGDQNVRIRPELNPALQHIKKVFCDNGSALFSSEENNFYICGRKNHVKESWIANKALEIILTDDKVLQIAPCSSNIAWRTQDGALFVMGHNHYGQFGSNKKFYKKPEIILLPPVARTIKNASVADLFYYSQGEGGYALYCYQQAINRIKRAVTALQIAALLSEFNTTACRNRADIKAILPAYHLVLQFVNDPANERQAWAVINTWARLLVMHRDFAKIKVGDYQKLREFMDALRDVSFPQSNVTFFQLPIRAYRVKMLADLQSNPEALRIAARFLIAELPPCPTLKRKAEADLEPERDVKKYKK